jgi:hypothetical protein
MRLWREGERMLERLPANSAESASIGRAVVELRSAHASLTDGAGVTPELLERATQMIDEAEAVIVRARRDERESA